ncbi:MAG: radical SAM family heme chaperone HemW [Crocinitomicaceae bacterium]|nr:radical SAM family heme chaperone HemW [Crocinitomicaceae bacterium]
MSGIYIHIPFCKQRCTYCDFHFSISYQKYYAEMIAGICAEIEQRKHEDSDEWVNTIYFGGGTPSLLKQKELKLIFETLRKNYKINPEAEITLEANPDDISTEILKIWEEAGINRLSVGLQSFRPEDLKWMNRAHNATESKRCIEMVKALGVHSLSIDLIYGLPNLPLKDWDEQIQSVIDYGVDHISAYCLTVEEKTALFKQVKEGKIITSDEDEQSTQYLYLVEKLRGAGYEQYEISNFCLPGKESKHNSSYWKGITYQGFGPSAHSFDGKKRRFNVRNNTVYLKNVNTGTNYYESENLSPTNRFNEAILTTIRTKWGVSLPSLISIQSPSQEFYSKVNEFSKKNWLKVENDTIFLTGEGWLMADYISAELFEV